MVLGHVGVGLYRHRVPHGVPAGGGGHRQLGELRPGDGALQGQVSVLVPHHDVQRRQDLGNLLFRRGGGQGGGGQPQQQHHRQQTG